MHDLIGYGGGWPLGLLTQVRSNETFTAVPQKAAWHSCGIEIILGCWKFNAQIEVRQLSGSHLRNQLLCMSTGPNAHLLCYLSCT